MFDLDLALRFAAALGLGLLLGIERERKRDAELFFGGVRTFALIALLGAVGAFMERATEPRLAYHRRLRCFKRSSDRVVRDDGCPR